MECWNLLIPEVCKYIKSLTYSLIWDLFIWKVGETYGNSPIFGLYIFMFLHLECFGHFSIFLEPSDFLVHSNFGLTFDLELFLDLRFGICSNIRLKNKMQHWWNRTSSPGSSCWSLLDNTRRGLRWCTSSHTYIISKGVTGTTSLLSGACVDSHDSQPNTHLASSVRPDWFSTDRFRLQSRANTH